MTQIRIEAVSGSVPISVFVSDIYGNNSTLIGTITNTGVIPPAARFYPPSLFNSAPQIMVTLIDNNGILDCSFGCGFVISVESASCVVTMTVTESSCLFETTVIETNCAAEPTLELVS
jgi:hypothetical protein